MSQDIRIIPTNIGVGPPQVIIPPNIVARHQIIPTNIGVGPPQVIIPPNIVASHQIIPPNSKGGQLLKILAP